MDSTVVDHDSIGTLVRGILMDVRTLIREEIALARVEVKAQVGRAQAAAIGLAIAAACLALGGTFLLVAVAMGIADALDWPAWAGFLVVAVVLSLFGIVMLAVGRRRLGQVRPVPVETVSTLKENSEWIAKRLSSAQR